MTHLSQTDHAAEWLAQQLASGPKAHQWIAEHSPYPGTTLKRAADKLGIITRNKDKYPRRTEWELPQ